MTKECKCICMGENHGDTSKFDIVGLLPLEQAVHLLSYLPGDDLLRCSFVSHTWRFLSTSNNLWQSKCGEEGIKRIQLDEDDALPVLYWKFVYMQRLRTRSNWAKNRVSQRRSLDMTDLRHPRVKPVWKLMCVYDDYFVHGTESQVACLSIRTGKHFLPGTLLGFQRHFLLNDNMLLIMFNRTFVMFDVRNGLVLLEHDYARDTFMFVTKTKQFNDSGQSQDGKLCNLCKVQCYTFARDQCRKWEGNGHQFPMDLSSDRTCLDIDHSNCYVIYPDAVFHVYDAANGLIKHSVQLDAVPDFLSAVPQTNMFLCGRNATFTAYSCQDWQPCAEFVGWGKVHSPLIYKNMVASLDPSGVVRVSNLLTNTTRCHQVFHCEQPNATRLICLHVVENLMMVVDESRLFTLFDMETCQPVRRLDLGLKAANPNMCYVNICMSSSALCYLEEVGHSQRFILETFDTHDPKQDFRQFQSFYGID